MKGKKRDKKCEKKKERKIIFSCVVWYVKRKKKLIFCEIINLLFYFKINGTDVIVFSI